MNPKSEAESSYAWMRLGVSVLLMTIGGSGMYSVTVALPLIQQEFGIARSSASLPYALTMIGFGIGGVLMGRLSDRFGVVVPVLLGAAGLAAGYIGAGVSHSLWAFALAQGLFIGLLGTSATFAPLVADISHWFVRRRGMAVAVCASGNYVAGAIWPPIMEHFFEVSGWRATYIGLGIFSLLAAIPLAWLMRRPPPPYRLNDAIGPAAPRRTPSPQLLGLSSGALMTLLCIAGVACCVAMSMPQVHIVASCGDRGYAAARGAEMM